MVSGLLKDRKCGVTFDCTCWFSKHAFPALLYGQQRVIVLGMHLEISIMLEEYWDNCWMILNCSSQVAYH
jgi:hypothetical protein